MEGNAPFVTVKLWNFAGGGAASELPSGWFGNFLMTPDGLKIPILTAARRVVLAPFPFLQEAAAAAEEEYTLPFPSSFV
jgi:hypothetical protein